MLEPWSPIFFIRLGLSHDGSSVVGQRDGPRMAMAEGLVEGQRQLVDRLRSRGHGHDQAVALLGEMERSLRLMRQTRSLVELHGALGQGAPCRPGLAA